MQFIGSKKLRQLGQCILSLALLSAISSGEHLFAQDTPLISGGVGFFTNTNGGSTSYSPTIAPVLAAPLGPHFLLESRANLVESISPREGSSYKTNLFTNFSYLQLDYLANSKLTLIGGQYLIPFGTYNERLSPIWISNFQDAPLITTIGNMNSFSGLGGEAKGSIYSNSKVNVDYAVYVSANSTNTQIQASRSVGDRIDVYFPEKRLEIGTSYGRLLAGEHTNSSGVHVWWEPQSVPLKIRSEYAHGEHAQGYWIEAAYRLSQWNGPDSWLGRLEPVFRMQQVFRNSPSSSDGLPAADTQRADFALDYHLPHEVRINTSYARQFSSTGNRNIWETGIVYRFLFPTWRGK
jgi:hypothetical protein